MKTPIPESLKGTLAEEVFHYLENPSFQEVLNFTKHAPPGVKFCLFAWINEENEEGLFFLIMEGKKGGTALKVVHQVYAKVSSAFGNVVSMSSKVIIIPNMTPEEVFHKLYSRQGIKFVKIIDKPNCIIAIAEK